jgi:hypothetical protein
MFEPAVPSADNGFPIPDRKESRREARGIMYPREIIIAEQTARGVQLLPAARW